MARKKIKLSCIYCKHWLTSREVLVGVRYCKKFKLKVSANSEICMKFKPSEYFFCPKKSRRIHIDICKNNTDNKKYGCGNCDTGKIIKLIFNR